MSKKYVIDDYGNKYEALDKKEVEATVGAGGIRECVFTGCIDYNGSSINYNYTGNLPDAAIVKNLLECGIDPTANNLTEAEVTDYLGLAMFSIHFYYLDTEIYVTNANGGYLAFEKIGEGTYKVYPRKVETGYHLKTETPIANIQFVTQKEYDNMAKKDDVFYYVTDAELEAKYATNAGHSTTADNATNATNANKATNADHAANATNANIAQYASNDTSKGTIEERLTALGFKEGTFTFTGISAENITTNYIKKQGKYVIANFGVKNVTSDIEVYVPEGFRPKENINISVVAILSSGEMGCRTCNVKADTGLVGGMYLFSGCSSATILNCGWETN